MKKSGQLRLIFPRVMESKPITYHDGIPIVNVKIPLDVQRIFNHEDGFDELMKKFIGIGKEPEDAFDAAVDYVKKYLGPLFKFYKDLHCYKVQKNKDHKGKIVWLRLHNRLI